MSRVIASLAAGAAVVAAGRVVHDSVDVAFAPFFLAGVFAPAFVGLFVALRRPENRIAWNLLLGSLSVAVVMLASSVAALDHDSTLGLWAATVAAP